MMPHPNELFEAAKQRLAQNQHDSRVANVQARFIRHWLAERVRHLADKLEPVTNHVANDMLPLVKR